MNLVPCLLKAVPLERRHPTRVTVERRAEQTIPRAHRGRLTHVGSINSIACKSLGCEGQPSVDRDACRMISPSDFQQHHPRKFWWADRDGPSTTVAHTSNTLYATSFVRWPWQADLTPVAFVMRTRRCVANYSATRVCPAAWTRLDSRHRRNGGRQKPNLERLCPSGRCSRTGGGFGGKQGVHGRCGTPAGA